MWLKAALPTWILEWNLTTWLFPSSSMQIENVVQCLPHKSTGRARWGDSNLRAGIKFQCVPIYKHLRQQKLSLCWCQGAETAWASNHGNARPVKHYGTKNPQRTQVCWTVSWIPEHVQLKTQLLKAMQAIPKTSLPPPGICRCLHLGVASLPCTNVDQAAFEVSLASKAVFTTTGNVTVSTKNDLRILESKEEPRKSMRPSIHASILKMTEMDRKGFTSCDVLMYLTRLELDIRTFTCRRNLQEAGQEMFNINVWSMRNQA